MAQKKMKRLLQRSISSIKDRAGFIFVHRKKITHKVRRKTRVVYRFRRSRSSPLQRAQYMEYKEKTRSLVHARIAYFIEQYKALDIEIVPSGRVAIRDSNSRWGSCSSKGNLNFHWKLSTIPSHLADYVVIHELCHLREFNHGPHFWKLVSVLCPEYEVCRQELKLIRLR